MKSTDHKIFDRYQMKMLLTAWFSQKKKKKEKNSLKTKDQIIQQTDCTWL